MKTLADRVAVITGASSGIGRATALELASRGASVVLASRDLDALQDVADDCNALGGRALAVAADVTREEDVQEVARRAVAEFGSFDVWINNAAVAVFAKLEDAPMEDYRRVIETNFFGYVHGARAALPQFRRQHRGVLINIDSVTAGTPQPYTSAYVCSKFAVRALSSCLRMEISLEKQPDIHVCNVMPSAIDTPFFQHAANYTGRAVKALDPAYKPEKVARAIAELIVNPKAEIVVGRTGKLMMAKAALAPRLFEPTFARHIDRNHLRNDWAPPSSGNLFHSVGPKAVRGGWRQRNPATIAWRAGGWLLAAAGAAAMVAVAVRSAAKDPAPQQ